MLSPPATAALEKASALARARALAASGAARMIRRNAGLSLQDVADVCGVAFATIHRWEVGDRRPAGDNAVAWVEFLDALAEQSNPQRRR